MKRYFLTSDLLLALVVSGALIYLTSTHITDANHRVILFVLLSMMPLLTAPTVILWIVSKRTLHRVENRKHFALLRESGHVVLIRETFLQARIASASLIASSGAAFLILENNLTDERVVVSLVIVLSCFTGARVLRSMWIIRRIKEIDEAALARFLQMITPDDQPR